MRKSMKRHIYADNAATTKIDQEAFNAMVPWLTDEYGNPSQPYSFAKKPRLALVEARETIAKCINANPEQIFFTSGGTESNNWAIKCFCSKNEQRVLISSPIEHHAILNAAKDAIGLITHFVSVNEYGEIDLIGLEKLLLETNKKYSSNTNIMVSVMCANNEIGTIQPIKESAYLAHKYGAIFHTDAVQAIGHIPIDVKDLDVDLLSASAHKFNGPKGIGFLYDKKQFLRIHNSGGTQEFGRRAGTECVASIVGMAVALKNNCIRLEENKKHIQMLEEYLLSGLRRIKLDFIRNGSKTHIPGNISLSFKNSDGEMLLHRLDLMGISVSTGAACDSSKTQLSHVLKAINCDSKYAEGTIRISLGKDNTTEECDVIINSLYKIINSSRK